MKYIVIKLDDVDKYLNNDGQSLLQDILDTIETGRINDNKKSNSYFVINTDDTELAAEVQQLFIKHGITI